jgi:hypothetical protein
MIADHLRVRNPEVVAQAAQNGAAPLGSLAVEQTGEAGGGHHRGDGAIGGGDRRRQPAPAPRLSDSPRPSDHGHGAASTPTRCSLSPGRAARKSANSARNTRWHDTAGPQVRLEEEGLVLR